MIPFRWCLITVCCGVFLAACNPGQPVVTGQDVQSEDETAQYRPAPLPDMKVGQRPDPSSDEAGLWLIVDRLEKKYKTAGNRITDPALNKYVQDIVCNLSGPYCPDIRVYLVRVPAFNATMAPNGMMMVWSGLLLRVRNEAQLAYVLGHELGHYLRRHSIKQFRNTRDTAGFLTFFSMGMAVGGIPIVSDIAALAAMGSISSYSRSDEAEADALGTERIAAAGYDPREAAKVWNNLLDEEKRGDVKRQFSIFLSTHPDPQDRERDLGKLAESLIKKNGAPGEIYTEKYRSAIAPFRTMMLRDEVRRRDYKRTLGLLDMLIEEGFRPGELHYFKGEVHRLRDDSEKNDREAAIVQYRKAIDMGGHPPRLFKSLGLLNVRMKKEADAKSAFRRYLELVPDDPDRDYILSIINLKANHVQAYKNFRCHSRFDHADGLHVYHSCKAGHDRYREHIYGRSGLRMESHEAKRHRYLDSRRSAGSGALLSHWHRGR